jgi:3-deoxy-7-phosphoheptulonate synthase
MYKNGTVDTNVGGYLPLVSPAQLMTDVPRTEIAVQTMRKGREDIKNILDRNDSRLLVIVGPCSIHDFENAVAYAEKIKPISEEIASTHVVVMRAYFEKPRTSVGWKGLINDPNLDGTYDINEGYRLSRRILRTITEVGLPTATEYLETITPQFNSDLVSWAAIGARTAYSPIHRQLISGLSMPVGIKNDTHGDISVAVNGALAGTTPQVFPGIDLNGVNSLVNTKGNKYAHVVLRGGGGKPNYDAASVEQAQQLLKKAGLIPNIVIDCSHDNTFVDGKKAYTTQIEVYESIMKQRVDGNEGVVGGMLESHLNGGNQKIPIDLADFDKSNLEFGTSITDACLDLETTVQLLRDSHKALSRTVVSVPGPQT